jgi:hypothetical protein
VSVLFSVTNSPTSITCKLDASAAAACTQPASTPLSSRPPTPPAPRRPR